MSVHYMCPDSYGCRCVPGAMICEKTALRHRAVAITTARLQGENVLLPFPIPIREETSVAVQNAVSSIVLPAHNSDSCESPELHESLVADDHQHHQSLQEAPPESLLNENSEEEYQDDESLDRTERSSNSDISLVGDDGDACLPETEQAHCSKYDSMEIQRTDLELLQFRRTSTRIDLFMRESGWLVGYCLKHPVTQSMMDDLLVMEKQDYYKSFKGLRKAILRESGLVVSRHNICSKSHMAIFTSCENSMACTHQDCLVQPATLSSFEYIGIPERLETRLRSSIYGPELYEYFQRHARRSLCESVPGAYIDFFSGSLFHRVVNELDGFDAIKWDIFLTLSTDGVQAFESTAYSYWPMVVFILNLPPSSRFRVQNILPVAVILGPKAPTNLLSFLEPFLEELEGLRKGFDVRMWDGVLRRVHVHLLFCASDLAALVKLNLLKGVNAIAPCSRCTIIGEYVHRKNHVYYPDKVKSHVARRGRSREEVHVLWDPRAIRYRTESEIYGAYERIRSAVLSERNDVVEDLKRQYGFRTNEITTLISKTETMKPFSSFVIDIMHLLYCNIGPRFVAHWFSKVEGEEDIALLSDKSDVHLVDQALTNSRHGISSDFRRPRALSDRGSWKANEWKFFIINLSTSALHDVLPRSALDGWWLFVQICELLSRWELSQRDLRNIETLSIDFFEHYRETYYKCLPERVHFCKFTNHLLLHLHDGIKECGPLSLLAQWGMENFIGDTNRRCNAKNLFAESVSENLKLQAAARMYSMSQNFQIPLLDQDGPERIDTSLLHVSVKKELEGYSFRHPRFDIDLEDASEALDVDLVKELRNHYTREGILSKSMADELIGRGDEVTVWARMYDEKTDSLRCTMYKGAAFNDRDDDRRSCYFAGYFTVDTRSIDVYYGKAHAFLCHHLEGQTHMLVLASWVSRGLRIGDQRQVFANYPVDSPRLFSNSRVDTATCIAYPLMVMECRKRLSHPRSMKKRNARCVTRTYFIDELREKHNSLRMEPNGPEKYILKGLVSGQRENQRR